MKSFKLFAVEVDLSQIGLGTPPRGQPEPGCTLNILNANPKRRISREAEIGKRGREMSPVMACELSFGECREQIFHFPALMQRGVPFIQAAVLRVCTIPSTLQTLTGWRAHHRRESKAGQHHCTGQDRKAGQAGGRH